MPEGQVLEFSAVTKRFGAVTAVDDFTARVEPGRVTGFLGPNGAGKTTTLRVLLGLVRATEGTATIGGLPYAKLPHPLRTVGAVLEASSFHPGRSAANHLKIYAQAAGLPSGRVDEALGLVGLGDVAGRKVGGYSLGMRQRLGLAYALIGDPGVLVLDEPANGLDPEGIKWMRGLLRDLARQGRTVFVSSHLLAEVQQTVDSLLIISAGRLVFQGALGDLADPGEYATVVDSGDRAALSAALRAAGVDFDILRSGLTVRGLDPAQVGVIAAGAGIPLTALQRRGPALEEIFLDLVNGTRVHASAADQAAPADAAPPAVGAVAAEPEAPDAAPSAAETSAETDAPDAAPVAAGAAGVAGVAALAGARAEEEANEPEDQAESEWEAEPDEDDEDAEQLTPAVAVPGSPLQAAAFAVASTGIIDIVPQPEPRPDGSDEADDGSEDDLGDGYDDPADADADGDERAGTEPAADEPADQDEPAAEEAAQDVTGGGETPAEPEPSSEWAAEDRPEETPQPQEREWKPPVGWAEPREWKAPATWTGASPVIDADSESTPEESAAGVESADSETSTGEPSGLEHGGAPVDQPEGEADQPPGVEDERPWEHYVKTDADLEADRFFAAFDAEDAEQSAADSIPDEREPLGTELETPAPEELGGHSPDWQAQPEPLPADDEAEEQQADEDEGGQHPEPVAEDEHSERPEDEGTSEDGAEDAPEVQAFDAVLDSPQPEEFRDADDATEGGEQR
ncbi:ATP-binding cassette domain-containing protein [Microbacterium sp. NPDC019599]|uniref:ATP-binding cassette domain-containing protein n=1 Tax=Microbacterium sp. NPDC019599 TaxID=3154690 RepID=UPI00340F429A